MSAPVLFVSLPLLPEVRARVAARRTAIFSEGESPLSTDAVTAAATAHRATAIMVSVGQELDAASIARLPDSVATIATYSVGYDHIDVAAARDRGIAVINTPDVLTDAVAEIAIFLMLGAARRATESIELLRSGSWKGWTPAQLPGTQVTGRRLGIFGMGRIGQCIARRARGFEMEIHYRSSKPVAIERAGDARYHASDESFLQTCDVLVLACAATPDTRHYLNAQRLALLPPHAIVVNIARGAVVNDDALIGALARGEIAGAGLDVFDNEPAIDPRYLTLPNAFLLPHIGSSTVHARLEMARVLLDALDALEAGETAHNALTVGPRLTLPSVAVCEQ